MQVAGLTFYFSPTSRPPTRYSLFFSSVFGDYKLEILIKATTSTLSTAALDGCEECWLAQPWLPTRTPLTEATTRGREKQGSSCQRRALAVGAWCRRPCPWEQRSAHELPALQPSRGQDRGSSGPSSFLEFWPRCCSDSSLWPRPPQPCSRLPHILKILCFPQEPVRCRTDGAGELPCCHVPGASEGSRECSSHLQPLTHSKPTA